MSELSAGSPSSVSLLPGIVDRPQSTLAVVVDQPRRRWVLPLLLCAAALIIYTVIAAPLLSAQAQQMQTTVMRSLSDQLSSMSPAERARMEEQLNRFTGPVAVAGATIVGGLLSLLLGWLAGSTILYIGSQLSGRAVGFAAIFAGLAWTWLPFALRDLVMAGWTAFTQKLIVNPGLSYFFSSGDASADARNALWRAAGLVDVYALWHVVLVYCLLKALSPRRSAIGLWLFYVVISVGLRLLLALLPALPSGF